MQPIVLGIVRHLLTAAGGALGMEGLATDGNINTVAGFVMFLVGVGMSIYDKKSK